MSIDIAKEKIGYARSQWIANWVLPYGSAYSIAYRNFEKTLDNQRKLDSLVAQIIMIALTVGVGGGLGALFGHTTIRAVAGKAVMVSLCRANLLKTLNVVVDLQTNKTAAFMLGKTWDKVGELISADVTSRLEALTQYDTNNVRVPENEVVAQNTLESYVRNVVDRFEEVVDAIRGHGVINQQLKDELGNLLLLSPVLGPPNNPQFDIQQAAKDMELAMYMAIVMDSDYEFDFQLTPKDHAAVRVGPVRPISASPRSQTYPKPSGLNSLSPSKTHHSVGYEKPGSVIVDQINTLHKKRFGEPFIVGSYGKDEVLRAEKVILMVNSIYKNKLQ
ncbi:hypothetical protein IWQ49_006048 [Labrenzia sp. EL_126]|nr:hypothetical protein [Labrenzia sp. EL_126]